MGERIRRMTAREVEAILQRTAKPAVRNA